MATQVSNCGAGAAKASTRGGGAGSDQGSYRSSNQCHCTGQGGGKRRGRCGGCGRKDELAHSSIRFSFGRFTSNDDVKNTLDILGNVVHRLRELSPLWEMHLDGIDLDKVEWNMH